MTDIRFYHLRTRTADQALPDLLIKAIATGHKILVRCANPAALSDSLWTFRPDAFLPHGTDKDGHAELQPVYLTDKGGNPNRADTLMIVSDGDTTDIDQFQLCCVIFDGRDGAALDKARAHWKDWATADHDITYWQQTEDGWQKKNVTGIRSST